MNKILSLLLLFTAISCTHEKKELVWLEGEWQRINDTDGQRTFENWHQQIDGSLKGKGFTLEGADSVFIENLALNKIDNAWQMIARGVHEESTYFEVTRLTNS
jgi:hypothetical protein